MNMNNNPTTERPLSGKTAVITGASSGIGRAVAEAFAHEGCNVVLAARGKEGLDETVQLCHDLGVAAVAVPTDMSVYEEVQKLADTALQFNGRIDFWVNNAGVMASGKFEEIPIAVNEQVIKTNLFGYMHGAYSVLPIFKKQKDGVLINNISIGGYMPAPYSAAYSASKFGIRGMMECLAGEISDFPHIHICNLYPQIQKSTGNLHSAKYSGLKLKIPPLAADPRDTAKAFVAVAKNPKQHTFPDALSYVLTKSYGLFPKAVINTASAGLRLVMKTAKAPDNPGNVAAPSDEPHRIYGKVPASQAKQDIKKALVAGIGLGLGYMVLKSKFSEKK